MSIVDESNLIAVSINLLYDGMFVQDDIYDADGDRLLVRNGNTLNVDQIERIRNLNSGRTTIYVTGRTHSAMMSKRPNIDIESRREVETSTGYIDIKDETFTLLNEMSHDKTVRQDALRSVSTELSHRLDSTPPVVIISLINALAPVDEYLQRHCVNVALLNGLIGQWMGLPREEVDALVLVGLLHDCGKTLIPPQVLNVPRKLTTIEYEVIKMHPVYTYDLLDEFPESVRRESSCHHERLNGQGYPYGLSNVDIPLGARITAISDVYDAIVSQRSYKKPQSPFSVLAQLSKLSGTDFDSKLVRLFTEHMPQELMGKPVTMSNGRIGILREYDVNDIEFPTVELNGYLRKSSSDLHCVSMYNDD